MWTTFNRFYLMNNQHMFKKGSSRMVTDVIIGRGEFQLFCSYLYRMFKKAFWHSRYLWRGNVNQIIIKRGKQAFRRTIHERNSLYPHLTKSWSSRKATPLWELNTSAKSCYIGWCLSKVIITWNRQADRPRSIENRLNDWFKSCLNTCLNPWHLIVEKEFSNWRSISNSNVFIFSQIQEHLRKEG